MQERGAHAGHLRQHEPGDAEDRQPVRQHWQG